MRYFVSPPMSKRGGLCSYPPCPCDEVEIPRGSGYLYITAECCDFRSDAASLEALEAKIERIQEERNQLIMLGPGIASPILMCSQGAKMLDLDLEIAAADARAWWETGEVPFRPTPKRGEPAREMEQRSGTVEHADGLRCHFCESAAAVSSSAAIATVMRGAGNEQTMDVKVPRCASCAAVHARLDSIAIRFAVAGLVLGAGIVLFRFVSTGTNFNDEPAGFFGTIVPAGFFGAIGGAVFFGIGSLVGKAALRPSGVKSESAKYQHPSVTDLLARGWASTNN